MDSVVKILFHKRLFLQLILFSWPILLGFIGFQYLREKTYKSRFLNAQMQQYNRHLLVAVEEGESYEDYISLHEKPFDDLRITLIALTGTVIYDNTIVADSLENHKDRPEVADALLNGFGYHIGRRSASNGRVYFYSATCGDRVIVRTAIPYSSTLRDLLRADGASFVIMISIILAMSIVAYFTTRKLGKDIERINRLESEQEKASLKRQLTENINHELKTPVASIQVCLETLLSGINICEEKRHELIGLCYMHNERLRHLLNDVSLITRMEEGSDLIVKEPVRINDIIDEVAGELSIMPAEERLVLHADFRDEVVVEGNPALIGAIFRNLTENSIAYSEGKNIYISLIKNSDKLCCIRFEDDGKGVREDQLAHLFERFYRVDKGRSRQRGGTGLGLAIVKHAVQFHGGTISVRNRATGGLQFDFTLRK